MPSRTLIALTLAAALLFLFMGAGCNLVTGESGSNAPDEVTAGKTHYGAFDRQRVKLLHGELRALLTETIGRSQETLDALDTGLAALEVPERFSTNDRVLRTWHQAEWDAYRAAVKANYDSAQESLQRFSEQAMVYAISRAKELVGKRSPLDAGPTGDTLVDQTITSFGESLRAEIPAQEIESRAENDALGRVELLHVFSTFTTPGADEQLGGRLILFIGGSEDATAPHVKLVLKGANDEAPTGTRMLQAIRYRVYRGHTNVQDLGWRPMPRGPVRTFYDSAMIIGNIEPRLDTSAPAFSELESMRVVADIQSVLVKDGAVLGGVDWRIEFRITPRGDVSWQLSGVPEFNPICAEAYAAFR